MISVGVMATTVEVFRPELAWRYAHAMLGPMRHVGASRLWCPSWQGSWNDSTPTIAAWLKREYRTDTSYGV